MGDIFTVSAAQPADTLTQAQIDALEADITAQGENLGTFDPVTPPALGAIETNDYFFNSADSNALYYATSDGQAVTAFTKLPVAAQQDNVIEDWAAATTVAANEPRIQNGQLWRSNAARTTGAAFDATEQLFWTLIGDLQDGVDDWVAATAYTAGDVVKANRNADGALWAFSRTADGTSGAAFDSTEEADWTQIAGLPADSEVLNTVELSFNGFGNSFTTANNLVLVDLAGADYTMSDWVVTADTRGLIAPGTAVLGQTFEPVTDGGRTVTLQYQGSTQRRGLSAIRVTLRADFPSTGLTLARVNYFSGGSLNQVEVGGQLGTHTYQINGATGWDFLTLVNITQTATTILDWTAATDVAENEPRIQGGLLWRSNSARTTGAAFDAAEQANWTQVGSAITSQNLVSGPGAPAAATGEDGDYYLQLDAALGTNDIWGPKAAGAWPAQADFKSADPEVFTEAQVTSTAGADYTTPRLASPENLDQWGQSRRLQRIFNDGTGAFDFIGLGYPDRVVCLIRNTQNNAQLTITYGAGGANSLAVTDSDGSSSNVVGQDTFQIGANEIAAIEKDGTTVRATVYAGKQVRSFTDYAEAVLAGSFRADQLVNIRGTEELFGRKTDNLATFPADGQANADWWKVGDSSVPTRFYDKSNPGTSDVIGDEDQVAYILDDGEYAGPAQTAGRIISFYRVSPGDAFIRGQGAGNLAEWTALGVTSADQLLTLNQAAEWATAIGTAAGPWSVTQGNPAAVPADETISTTEVDTGKVWNGKSVYRRQFQFTGNFGSATILLSGVEAVLSANGWVGLNGNRMQIGSRIDGIDSGIDIPNGTDMRVRYTGAASAQGYDLVAEYIKV